METSFYSYALMDQVVSWAWARYNLRVSYESVITETDFYIKKIKINGVYIPSITLTDDDTAETMLEKVAKFK